MTARSKLTARFIEALQQDFEAHGSEVIEKLRQESPGKYAEVVARLCPAEQHITQESAEYVALAKMSPDERDEYLISLTERYWAKVDEAEAAKEKRARIRSFHVEEQ
jgi:hypothetical protein